jgi:hypothetical protein
MLELTKKLENHFPEFDLHSCVFSITFIIFSVKFVIHSSTLFLLPIDLPKCITTPVLFLFSSGIIISNIFIGCCRDCHEQIGDGLIYKEQKESTFTIC